MSLVTFNGCVWTLRNLINKSFICFFNDIKIGYFINNIINSTTPNSQKLWDILKREWLLIVGKIKLQVFIVGFTGCMHVVSNNSLVSSILPDNLNEHLIVICIVNLNSGFGYVYWVFLSVLTKPFLNVFLFIHLVNSCCCCVYSCLCVNVGINENGISYTCYPLLKL